MRERGWWEFIDEPAGVLPTVTVVESEEKWSGLYDAEGQKLMKPKQPIGFIVLKERER